MKNLEQLIKRHGQDKEAAVSGKLPYSKKDRKLLRKLNDMTQMEAAAIISDASGEKISRPRFANWEDGTVFPNTEELLKCYVEFLRACEKLTKK